MLPLAKADTRSRCSTHSQKGHTLQAAAAGLFIVTSSPHLPAPFHRPHPAPGAEVLLAVTFPTPPLGPHLACSLASQSPGRWVGWDGDEQSLHQVLDRLLGPVSSVVRCPWSGLIWERARDERGRVPVLPLFTCSGTLKKGLTLPGLSCPLCNANLPPVQKVCFPLLHLSLRNSF